MHLIRLFICCVAVIGFVYLPALLGFANIAAPDSASGSLIRNAEGTIIGSRHIAQAFTSDRYFHPRPSAVDYDGQGAGGSNLSPTNPAIADRARDIITQHQATDARPIPADLVTASGSGLDPDITLAAALFQAPRIANARGIPEEQLIAIIQSVKRPLFGAFGGEPLINVLELNLALDSQR